MAYGSYTVSRHPCSSGEHPDRSARQTRMDPLLNVVNWHVSRSALTLFLVRLCGPFGGHLEEFLPFRPVAGADAGNDPAFKPADGRPPSRWWRA